MKDKIMVMLAVNMAFSVDDFNLKDCANANEVFEKVKALGDGGRESLEEGLSRAIKATGVHLNGYSLEVKDVTVSDLAIPVTMGDLNEKLKETIIGEMALMEIANKAEGTPH